MSLPDHIGEARYVRLILHQVPGFVWTTDRHLRVTYVRSRVPALKGIEPQEILGKEIQEVTGVRDPTQAPIAQHLRALAGESQSFRYWFRDRCLEVLIEPLYDEEAKLSGCIAVAVDMTERRDLEVELELMRRRYEEAQEVAHVGSFEWDIVANVVTWSDELYRIHGINKGQFAGTYESFLSFVHPDDRKFTEDVVLGALRHTEPFEYDHRIICPDGAVRSLRTRGCVILDDVGTPIRLVGSCWDSTKITEATRRLEDSISLLEATINATADGILVVDLRGRVVTYNQRFATMWRIPPDLASRRDDKALLEFVVDQLKDPEGFVLGVHELYGKPERESFDTLLFKDGRVFERLSAPQRLGHRIVGRVWSFRDVTERERAERQAKEAVGVLAIAAHDVRNPLGGMELQLDVMSKTLAEANPSLDSLRKQIAMCHRFVARASDLLSSLLDVAQVGAGRLKLHPEATDLAQLTRDVVSRLRPEADASRSPVALKADGPVFGLWDRDRLDQIVANLLSNALRYGRGKPVEIAVQKAEAKAYLTVTDHGIGISPRDRELIFNQFERAVAEGKGVGLGLWIVRKLATALGGRIQVESKWGEGSLFTLELPLTFAAEGMER